MRMAHGLLFRDMVTRYDIDELPFVVFMCTNIWIWPWPTYNLINFVSKSSSTKTGVSLYHNQYAINMQSNAIFSPSTNLGTLSSLSSATFWQRVFISTVTIRLADARSFFLASMMRKPLIFKLYTDRLPDDRSRAGDSDRSVTQAAPRRQPAGGASTSKGTSPDSQRKVTSSKTAAITGSSRQGSQSHRVYAVGYSSSIQGVAGSYSDSRAVQR